LYAYQGSITVGRAFAGIERVDNGLHNQAQEKEEPKKLE
jgi:hypothetical protein